MARLSLLSFAGCPHADAARDALRAALRALGWPEAWEEIDLASPECPESLRGFPSPTILLDGAELASGRSAAFGSLCCSAAKAPTPEALAAQLRLRAGAGRQAG